MKKLKEILIKTIILILNIILVPLVLIVDLIDSALWILYTKVEPKVVWRKHK